MLITIKVTCCLFSFRFSHHCGDCEFDVCQDCFKPHITPLHEHPLYRADSHHVYVQFNGGWRCDRCGSVHNNPVDNKPWHCQTCEFDLCNACMSSTIEGKDSYPVDKQVKKLSPLQGDQHKLALILVSVASSKVTKSAATPPPDRMLVHHRHYPLEIHRDRHMYSNYTPEWQEAL